ncbi:MAG: ABC transporter permease [Phycisphaerales bacterium]|nr:MAG: ABC transporter permease [Phycisphaerales bacterium]
MRTLWQDIHYGFRMLVRNPGFAITAVLCLGLGIGVCTAVFSVVNALLLRPLPFTDSERLIVINEYNLEDGYHTGVSPRLFLDLQEQTPFSEDIAFFQYSRFHLTGGEFPEAIRGHLVLTNLFELLDAKPLLGRTFLPGEGQPGKDSVVVISHSLWQRRFGGDPNLVGKTISVLDTYSEGGHAKEMVCTVVGIMPPRFEEYLSLDKPDIWQPKILKQRELKDRKYRQLIAVARLKAGISRRQAQAQVDLLSQRLAKQYPQSYERMMIRVRPLRSTFVFEEIQESLLMLVGAGVFVLLIACANVGNMLLARATWRQREVAVRTTLGAGRLRLIRQLLTESLLLSLLGAALGLLLAHWGIGLLKPLIPFTFIPLSKDVGVDLWTLGCTLVILVVTGIAFGLAPALQLSKPNLTKALKEGGGAGSVTAFGRKPIRNLLVVSQVALTLVLLVGAGLLVQTLVRMLRVNPGFEPRHLMKFEIRLPVSRYGEPGRRATFYAQLLERIRSLPSVQSVAAMTGVGRSQYMAEGQTTPTWVRDCKCSIGTHDYLHTMGIPLLQGRYLTNADIAGPDNSIVINETMALQFWPGENPIGKRLTSGGRGRRSFTVVGVVADHKLSGYASEYGPAFYIPYGMYADLSRQSDAPNRAVVVVRSTVDPLSLVTAIRREVAALDSHLPVSEFSKFEDRLRGSTALQRLYMQLLTAFAVIGLILAAAGIYGLVSYSVARRTHEIGVRMALGARHIDVLKLVIRKGLILILVGLVIGVAGALALTRVLASLLFGVTATDPMTFVAVSLLLMVVGLVACYIPARRATKIDPMSALRYE